MNIKLLPSACGYAPYIADDGSAGLDLITTEDVLLEPNIPMTVGTGMCVEIPTGCFGLVVHRSSLAFKLDVVSSTGIVDSSYRGEIKVRLFNLGLEPVFLKKLDRIAQLVVIPYRELYGKIDIVDELSDTTRGEGGFGSSGV
jgi:dUTP pyrophosphatase